LDINLNQAQQEAVDTLHGPVLIMAGAGSGKTRTLINRIDNLIRHGVKPETILAITFTNKAARELKSRLSLDAANVEASTIHSFCVKILRQYAHVLGYSNNFLILDTSDAQTVIGYAKNDIADAYVAMQYERFPHREPNAHFILEMKDRTIQSAISKAKNDGISAHEYMNYQHRVDEYPEVITAIFKKYEEIKLRENSMDFDDLLVKTCQLLRDNPAILEIVQNTYHYIMVDEYQDVNDIQDELVNLISAKNRNICVVGDPDQSIYKFRGSKVENIIEFNRTYPDTKIIHLDENYRSEQVILDAANDVINNNSKIANKERRLFSSNTSSNDLPMLVHLDTQIDEATYIAEQIKDYIQKGGKYSDIAILYRNNAISKNIDMALRNASIPFEIHGGLPFYQRKEIKDIIAYLTVMTNPYSTVQLKRIINVPRRGIGNATITEIENYAKLYNPILNIPQVLTGHLDNIKLPPARREKLDHFTSLYTNINYNNIGTSIKELIEYFYEQTGYLNYLMDEDNAEERLDNAKEFLSDAQKFDEEVDPNSDTLFNRCGMFLQKIALQTNVDKNDESEEKVTLMTLHASKGLEFPFVIIAGCEEGTLPSNLAIRAKDVPEERRLMYVGMTRAEKKLIMTAVKERLIYGQYQAQGLSRFVTEIKPEHVNYKEIKSEKPQQNNYHGHNHGWGWG
jgi:ATP-dependent DNA helicase pcrA